MRKKIADAECSSLMKYINSYVKKYPLPNNDTNIKNLKLLKILKNDPTKEYEYKKLRDQLVLSNGGFGMKYTMKYYKMLNDEECLHDLFQEANRGLIEAIDAFNVDYGVTFTTYAFFYIRKCIIDYIKIHKLIKAPREISKNIKHVAEARDKAYTINKGFDSLEDVREILKNDKHIELTPQLTDHIMRLLDLSASYEQEQFISEYSDQIAVYPDDDQILTIMGNIIEKNIKDMHPMLKELLISRYGVKRDFCMQPSEIIKVLDIQPFDYKIIRQVLIDEWGYDFQNKFNDNIISKN